MMQLRKLGVTILVSFLASVSAVFAGDGWMTDIDAAQKLGKEQKKSLFVEFTGSDWCPPCMMMEKNVFSKAAFKKGAEKDFILVKIDIPNGDEALRAKNEKVLEKYNVSTVPTVILFDANGKEFSRFSASAFNSVEKMLAELQKQLKRKDMF